MKEPITMIKSLSTLVIALAIMVGMSSCGNTRKLQYMQGAFDTARLSTYTIPEPVIQQGDLLTISVYSKSATASAIYNQGAASGGGASGSGVASGVSGSTPSAGGGSGYLVDGQGNIRFQDIGSLHVEGLTKRQLTARLDSLLQTYLTDPYCVVRFVNYKITMIGDVARPGVYSIPSERVNILEAIGLAGDLNITGRRDNVLVMREQNGKRLWGRLDLTKSDIFSSPFYQLQQNDVVYVDLSRAKAVASDQTTIRNISIITGVVSTVAIIITILRQ